MTYVIVLAFLLVLQVVLVRLELHDLIPELLRFLAQLVHAEALDLERFDAEAERNLLVLGELLLRLVHLLSGSLGRREL